MSESPRAINLYDIRLGVSIYIPRDATLNELEQMFGTEYEEISSGGPNKNDRTYCWTRNGMMIAVALRNKRELVHIYSRFNCSLVLPGYPELPWKSEVILNKYGKPTNNEGDDAYGLLAYVSEKYPFIRFDVDFSKGIVTGFLEYGPVWDDWVKTMRGLKKLN